MEIFEEILKHVSGKAELSIEIEGKPAAAVKMDGKKITIDVLDPAFAMKFAGQSLFRGKGFAESGTLAKLKKAGFTIKAKYMMLEIGL